MRTPPFTKSLREGPEQPKSSSDTHIIDIRQDGVEMYLKDEILNQLKPESGLKHIPTILLYNERGLQIYEEVGSLRTAESLSGVI